MNALLLRPLAVRDPGRTVYVYHADPANPDRGTSFAAYQRYRDRTDMFSAVMAFSGSRPLFLIDRDRRDQVYAELVTADYFSMANVRLRLGRPFDREIDRIADPQFVAILSHAFWRRRFASDPAIVGSAVNLNGRPFTILGVAEPGFTGLESEVAADLWIPMTTWAHLIGEPARLTSDEHWVTTVAELKDGVTLEQARGAMAAAGQSFQPPPGQQTKVRPVRQRSPGSAGEVLALGAGAFAVGLLVLVAGLHERGEPADRARRGASARDVGPGGARRQPRPAPPLVADRESAPLRVGRHPRPPRRLLDPRPRRRLQAADVHRTVGGADAADRVRVWTCVSLPSRSASRH